MSYRKKMQMTLKEAKNHVYIPEILCDSIHTYFSFRNSIMTEHWANPDSFQVKLNDHISKRQRC